MLFKQAQDVVDGIKWQTRRPVKPGEWAFMDVDDPTKILSVIGANGCLKWQLGKDYAAQPGRGKKSIGRTPPIEAIRRERLQEITNKDVFWEGLKYFRGIYFLSTDTWFAYKTPRDGFLKLWNSIYRKPYRWEDNPEVWCLSFELAEQHDALA